MPKLRITLLNLPLELLQEIFSRLSDAQLWALQKVNLTLHQRVMVYALRSRPSMIWRWAFRTQHTLLKNVHSRLTELNPRLQTNRGFLAEENNPILDEFENALNQDFTSQILLHPKLKTPLFQLSNSFLEQQNIVRALLRHMREESDNTQAEYAQILLVNWVEMVRKSAWRKDPSSYPYLIWRVRAFCATVNETGYTFEQFQEWMQPYWETLSDLQKYYLFLEFSKHFSFSGEEKLAVLKRFSRQFIEPLDELNRGYAQAEHKAAKNMDALLLALRRARLAIAFPLYVKFIYSDSLLNFREGFFPIPLRPII